MSLTLHGGASKELKGLGVSKSDMMVNAFTEVFCRASTNEFKCRVQTHGAGHPPAVQDHRIFPQTPTGGKFGVISNLSRQIIR